MSNEKTPLLNPEPSEPSAHPQPAPPSGYVAIGGAGQATDPEDPDYLEPVEVEHRSNRPRRGRRHSDTSFPARAGYGTAAAASRSRSRSRTVRVVVAAVEGDDGAQGGRICDPVFARLPCKSEFLYPALGISLVVMAGFGFTAGNVLQNWYLKDLNFFHMLFVRAMLQILISMWDIANRKCGLMGGATSRRLRARLVAQGLIGGLLLLSIFYAVSNVPLGNASSIFFCTPVFTFLFALCMLNEKFGVFRGLLSVLMIAGVILITRPPFLFAPDDAPHADGGAGPDAFHTVLSYSVAFCVPLFSAVVSILTRQLKHLPATVLMFWFGIGAFVASTAGSLLQNDLNVFEYTAVQWRALLFVVITGIVGNLLYTLAMRWVSPSKANVFRSFEVILNYVLQIYLQGYSYHPESAGGIVCLLLAVLGIALEPKMVQLAAEKAPGFVSRLW